MKQLHVDSSSWKEFFFSAMELIHFYLVAALPSKSSEDCVIQYTME